MPADPRYVIIGASLAGAKAADRSACDCNGEVGLCVPVHYRTCLTGTVPASDDP